MYTYNTTYTQTHCYIKYKYCFIIKRDFACMFICRINN